MFYDYFKSIATKKNIAVGTHDGVFHADEVFACALLRMAHKDQTVTFIRTRDPQKLEGCDYRVDVGGIHCPETGDFDHHQEAALPSSFGLVYEAVILMCPLNDMSEPFFTSFVKGVDVMDCDPTSVVINNPDVRFLSQIISGFNRVGNDEQESQFLFVVKIAEEILKNEFKSAQDKGQAEIEYFEREILQNGVAVFPNFSPIWKDKGDHQFAVMPYSKPGQWQIVAADTTIAALPETVSCSDGFIFRHPSGFMATFISKKAAIQAAIKI